MLLLSLFQIVQYHKNLKKKKLYFKTYKIKIKNIKVLSKFIHTEILNPKA